MNGKVAVFIDRDRLFSAAFASLIGGELEVRAIHDSAESAVAHAGADDPVDFVVIDPVGLAGGGRDASALLRGLRATLPEAGLVVLSSDLSDGAIKASLDGGADAHLSKSAPLDTVRRSLALVALGQSVFPAQAARLVAAGAGLQGGSADAGELSTRETQILACLLGGLSNKAIARRLEITESTVKMHFKNVMRKIKAANRTQAAVWAIDQGVQPLSPLH